MGHKERTKTEFTRQAQGLKKSSTFTDRELLERISSAAGATAGKKILDVACGPGIVVEALARAGGVVTGIDITPEMVERAKERCKKAGLENVEFHEGEAEKLPFDGATFDAVVSRLTIHHFVRPSEVLSEIHRVLRPGGLCVIADIISADNLPSAELHNALETLRDPTHVWAYSEQRLIEMVETTGFNCWEVTRWKKVRTFDEWIAITSASERVGPVGAVMKALAQNDMDAGIGLRLEDGITTFEHSWVMIAAEKK